MIIEALVNAFKRWRIDKTLDHEEDKSEEVSVPSEDQSDSSQTDEPTTQASTTGRNTVQEVKVCNIYLN